MNRKPLVWSIFENAERSMTLSNVSIGISPIAKKPAKVSIVSTPEVADATTDKVMAEIYVAVSNPSPHVIPVTTAEYVEPKTPVLFKILLASIAEPLLPHFFIELC